MDSKTLLDIVWLLWFKIDNLLKLNSDIDFEVSVGALVQIVKHRNFDSEGSKSKDPVNLSIIIYQLDGNYYNKWFVG